MGLSDLKLDDASGIKEIAGYLNYSEGAENPKFLGELNALMAVILQLQAADGHSSNEPATQEIEPWQALHQILKQGFRELENQADGAFSDLSQANAVLSLTFDEVLPAYLQFHSDLLFHQSTPFLFNSFFIGRTLQAVLQQTAPWDQKDRIVSATIATLNDFIGYRPVAVLENDRRVEPYPHEWIRPIPLYIESAGVACGKYEKLISLALHILNQLEPSLLEQAWYIPENLSELAVDPRACDFDHPVNKRPNYHFGQWDPHSIDNRGFYRRYVIQQVTLESLSKRLHEPSDISEEDLLFEAAAVLVCTILMGSGVAGSGPQTHDSTVTLSSLLPLIAKYRDEYYQSLDNIISKNHARRLRAEAVKTHQPLGVARQHVNSEMARLRAAQMEHVHLAYAYSRMGYTAAATEEANIVPSASARMLCKIHCQLAASQLDLDTMQSPAGIDIDQKLHLVSDRIESIEEMLLRSIQCGAMIDPWNILGFDANFSLFPTLENSIYDHRVDQLVEVMQGTFDLYLRSVGQTAAAGLRDLQQQLIDRLEKLASWWDQFATTTVSSIESISGHDTWQAALHISNALSAWHQEGTASGDIVFWRKHVEHFQSPQTYSKVIEALLEKNDHFAAMGLLVQWSSVVDEVALEEADNSFFALAQRWMYEIVRSDHADRWVQARKFLEYLEANSDEYWEVPRLEIGKQIQQSSEDLWDDLLEDAEDFEDDSSDLFDAAYEDVVYRDSTADGVDGQIFDSPAQATDYELEIEARRISRRLDFLNTLSGIWRILAIAATIAREEDQVDGFAELQETLPLWSDRCRENREQLLLLIESINAQELLTPEGDLDSMIEYDRRRTIKEAILDQVVNTCVEVADATHFLMAADNQRHDVRKLDTKIANLIAAILQHDEEKVQKLWPALLRRLRKQTVLYIPLVRGGSPQRIVAARTIQRTSEWLLRWLPRIGQYVETSQLIDAIRHMEADHPVGSGSVTEFDRMFETGFMSMVQSIIHSSEKWESHQQTDQADLNEADTHLIESLHQLTDVFLSKWLRHSQTLRLSVLEKIENEKQWQALVRFSKKYGSLLFTQYFLNFGNIRAILHQGVRPWIDQLIESQTDAFELDELMNDLGKGISLEDADDQITTILEAVLENFSEYRDYNSTTTQSDRGECIYMFIDFLRLRSSYQRVQWNLKPVIIVHELLVRNGRSQAASLWRNAVAEKTEIAADQCSATLAKLQEKYSMQLPTIANHIRERFVRPLFSDQIRALVKPAMEEIRNQNNDNENNSEENKDSFKQLQQMATELAKEPTGVGLDLPEWLEQLENEVESIRQAHRHQEPINEVDYPVRLKNLAHDQIQQQLGLMNNEIDLD